MDSYISKPLGIKIDPAVGEVLRSWSAGSQVVLK
jgi:hypothetical protein